MNGRLAIRLLLAGLLVAGISWAAAHREMFAEPVVRQQLESLGPWAPVAFVVTYALAAVLFLPGSVLSAVGGALFGPVAGTAWSLLGATLGATLSFLLARYIVGDVVRARAGARLDALLRGVEEDGWRFVALVRIVPLFPFNLSNYALGLTRIGLVPYVLASAVFMLPGAAAFAFLGHSGRGALAGDSRAIGWGLAALGLLSTFALLPRLLRRGRSQGPERVIEPDE